MSSTAIQHTKVSENLVISRLNNPRLWGRELFIFAFIVNAVLTVVMDVVRQGSITWLWLVPFAVTFAAATLLGFGASIVVRRFAGNPRLWLLNMFFAVVIGSLKNFAVGFVADMLGLANDATAAYRLFGGAIMGIALVFFLAMSIGARASHREAVSQLVYLQTGLVNRKKRLEQTVEDENAKLVRTTNEILIPKLRNIEELLSQGDSSHETIQALRSTIENDIRPLTRDIQPAALLSTLSSTEERQVKIRKIRFPKLIDLRSAIRPTASWIYNAISFGVLIFFFAGFLGSLLIDITVTIEVLLLALAKRLISVDKKSRGKALFQLSVIALLCSIPNYLVVIYLSEGKTSLFALTALVIIISVGSLWGSAYSSILDTERLRVEKEIAKENEDLAHEIAIYEQRIWVFKKSWQLLLHGTVQAALTAALTRLTMPTDDEVLRSALVRQDLARAKVSLQATPVRELDLHRCIADITSSWRGVCDVSVKVSERAARALKRSFEVMFGVNEIMREAVSNSVRHGAATVVEIEIDRESDDLIQFTSKNNGIPLSLQASKGMGSKMMDELTLDWSLTQDERLRKTVLRASIPVAI